MIVIEVKSRTTALAETLRVAIPVTTAPLLPVKLAVMVVVPPLTALASPGCGWPAELIVATFTSLDRHVAWVVRSCVVGLPL